MPQAEADLFATSPWLLPGLRVGTLGTTCYRCAHFVPRDSPSLWDAAGAPAHICDRCFAVRTLRLNLSLAAHDLDACAAVEDELETAFARLANVLSHGEYEVPTRAGRAAVPRICVYCDRAEADHWVLTLDDAMISICRSCWYCRHLRLLSRFLPSNHRELLLLDEALARCHTVLRRASFGGVRGAPPSHEAGRRVSLVHPDEHLDGGPAPGPTFWLRSPCEGASLTPPTPREMTRWRDA